MTRSALVLAVTVFPLGCMAQTGADDTCGAAGFQGLVGQTGEIARLLVLDTPVRVIPPDTPVTMDFRLERINFNLDAEGIIVEIVCG